MTQSRSFRNISAASLLALLGAAACDTQTTASAQSTPSAITAAPSPIALAQNDVTAVKRERGGKRGKHGRGGRAFLLRAALRKLTLSDAQRATIQEAIAQLPRRARPDGSHFKALAAGVRAGRIDVDAIVASAPAPDFRAHAAGLAKALATLHQTLTAEQRRELVDAVAKRHAGGARHFGGKGRGGRMGGPIRHILRGLDLSDAQKDAVRAQLKALKPSDATRESRKQRFQGIRAEMQARLQTFANDDFDANAFVAPPAGARAGMGPKHHVEKMAKALSAITQILEPAQREKLAARLEQGPSRSKRRPAMIDPAP